MLEVAGWDFRMTAIGNLLELRGVLLANNASDSGTGADCLLETALDHLPKSLGYNLIGNNESCAFSVPSDLVGTPSNPVDPLLGDLIENGGPTLTQALLPGSPAIDHGPTTGCPAVDQRGFTRPMDGDNDTDARCDIGAFEVITQMPYLTAFDHSD